MVASGALLFSVCVNLCTNPYLILSFLAYVVFSIFLFSLFGTQNAVADLRFNNTIGQTTGDDLMQVFACIAFFKALKSSMPQYIQFLCKCMKCAT